MPRPAWIFFLGSLAVFLTLDSELRAAPDHPIVPGFERFHASGKNEAQGGRLLLGELNCTSCHQSADPTLTRKQAPILDGVGQRVRITHLKKFLSSPHAVKPGTTMPDLLAGDADKDKKVEALVHFLASQGSIKHERPSPQAINEGRDLYGKVGCVACHGTRNGAGDSDKVLPASVPLGEVKGKYSITSLAVFLENPQHARPSGRMPRLLNAKEAKAVANYLLQGIKVEIASSRGATNYSYYEGSWTELPDFSKLKPKATGKVAGFDLHVAQRSNEYALKFEGVLKVDQETTYSFILNSDDGSRLTIDGKEVVNNDGIHPPKTSEGRSKLTKGIHKVVLTFFQGGGGAELEAFIEAPGFGRHNLADLLAVDEAALEKKPEPRKNDEDSLEIQPALAEQGKTLFASLGCASCHQLSLAGKPIVSSLKATTLDKLTTKNGCLAEKPAAGLPIYALNEIQRKALASALTSKPAERTPADIVAQTMTTFNCYACHVRAKVGGPEDDLNKSFQTTQPEMGDEGRLPPPLDGVGAKLVPTYLKQLLDKGAHDRPYMHTRMPGFGDANVGHLVEIFDTNDKLPATPAVTFSQPATRIKATGRHLVGGMAFGCIKCHTFAGIKAEGVQGIDMILMPQRLKRDWFHAYIEDPQKIRPGTRMPSAFVAGKSVLPDILEGKSTTQIEAMWAYLQDGTKARLPLGLQRSSIPLIPTGSAILYRNFIEGAGSRAIGVGYPEKVNLAFDANEMRMAMLWQGGFIDAAKHWTDRGSGFEGPLGDNILRLHSGAPFATLSKADEAWPTAPAKTLGYRFLGYRLTPDDRPTFSYAFGDIQIQDFPNAGNGTTLIRRTFTLTTDKPIENLYYRAAVGTKIEPLKDGWFQVDDWKVHLPGSTPRIRKGGDGKAELLVPILFKDGKAQLMQDYAW